MGSSWKPVCGNSADDDNLKQQVDLPTERLFAEPGRMRDTSQIRQPP